MPSYRLRLTPSADRTARTLRGRAATAWERMEGELKAQGCAAGGYRLLGEDGSWCRFGVSRFASSPLHPRDVVPRAKSGSNAVWLKA